jgi:hypothetical protein
MRIIAVALAAILASTGLSYAQYAPSRTTAVPPSTAAPSATPKMQAGQFSTEGDAKAHCSGQSVVWMNNPSKIYHYAGSRDYGHTKSGAYMCQADADKMGRAAKNEKAPPPGKPASGTVSLPAGLTGCSRPAGAGRVT